MRLIRYIRKDQGITLVELMVSLTILSIILGVISGVFFSSDKMYRKTNYQMEAQMSARLAMEIISKEIRHAGCDPKEIGVSGVVYADADSLHILEDLNGDGIIQSTEPSENITYYYDKDRRILYRDPGTGAQTIMQNVVDLNFDYRDGNNDILGPLPLTGAQASRVRFVSISITVRTRNGDDMVLSTSVAIRNV